MYETIIRDGSDSQASITRVTAENFLEVRALIRECDEIQVATRINLGDSRDTMAQVKYIRITKQQATAWYKGLPSTMQVHYENRPIMDTITQGSYVRKELYLSYIM